MLGLVVNLNWAWVVKGCGCLSLSVGPELGWKPDQVSLCASKQISKWKKNNNKTQRSNGM